MHMHITDRRVWVAVYRKTGKSNNSAFCVAEQHSRDPPVPALKHLPPDAVPSLECCGTPFTPRRRDIVDYLAKGTRSIPTPLDYLVTIDPILASRHAKRIMDFCGLFPCLKIGPTSYPFQSSFMIRPAGMLDILSLRSNPYQPVIQWRSLCREWHFPIL